MLFEEAARACADLDNMSEIASIFAPQTVAALSANARKAAKKACKDALPWDPVLKFQKFLAIQGQSFQEWMRPYVLDTNLKPGPLMKEPRIDIPGTDFYYCHPILEQGDRLRIASGKTKGTVVFDADIFVPCLRQKAYLDDEVWMSFTPFEVFTLRAGIRAAKGDVVIGGLGLGYQLIEISKKKSVRKITLVEQNFALFQWVWPRIRDKVQGNITVLFGDAREIIPKLKADRAIIDIDSTYGNNYFPGCPYIDRTWVWGSSAI